MLDSSKLKEFADDNFKFDENGSKLSIRVENIVGKGEIACYKFNFKFDENGRKLSKRVKNIVGKGEIACYKHFLLFPQCFQKACFPEASKGVIVWEWVNFRGKLVHAFF